MAKLAGLELGERWADWNQTPFTADSTSHVSVWQKPTRLVSSSTRPRPSPELVPPLQVRGAAVLTGCAISVPFRARRHRSATVHHGHSRRFTSASSTTTGAWQHEW